MRHTYIFLIIITASLATGCNKKLDLAPEGTLTENAALKDSANTTALLAGAYLNLWQGSTADAYTLGDLTTGISAASINRYATGSIDAKDQTIGGIWNTNYATINLTNVLIVKLPQAASYHAVPQYVAEAKFIRAFSYFNLLKLFGDGALQGKPDNMGVPLRLDPFNGYDGSQNIPRAANGQVYDRIIEDLNEAIPNLPAAYNSDLSQRSRATKSAARALAARVSLYRKDYDRCNAWCDTVLSDAHYILQNTVTGVFTNNGSGTLPYAFNPEIIFAFPVSYNKDPTQYAFNNTYYYYGFVYPDPGFVSGYDPSDLRRTAMIVQGASWSSHPTTIKFSDPNDKDNLVMLRVSEILLDKAEALAYKNGLNQASVDLLNQVHQRAFPAGSKPAPYTLSGFSDGQALIGQILQERQWELAFEGQDRFDKIRSGKQPNPALPVGKYALPIPQADIDMTSGLIKQNPGY